MPLWLLIYLSGNLASSENQRLLDTQRAQVATVVKAETPFPSRGASPDVTVTVAGREVVLVPSFPGDRDVAAGDRIDVVVDPEAPPTSWLTTATTTGSTRGGASSC